MKPEQKLWSSLFLFGPAIYIGIEYDILKGLLAFVLTFVLGAIIGQISIKILSIQHMKIWAYVKGPFVAAILILGFYWFNNH
ncbi:MAG: hypothetical protein AAFQ20_00095 [Bacteroidota bacterium]